MSDNEDFGCSQLMDAFSLYMFSPYTTSVADPDPGSGAFLTPGSGSGIRDGKYPDLDPRSRIWDEHHRSFFRELRNIFLNLFSDPDPGSEIPNLFDPQ